jgi:hypothetical protein
LDSSRVRDALDVVIWLGERANQLPEEKASCLTMQVTLAITGLYLAEYAFHRDQGRDAYDSLVGTARGDLQPTEAAELWAGLMPPR